MRVDPSSVLLLSRAPQGFRTSETAAVVQALASSPTLSAFLADPGNVLSARSNLVDAFATVARLVSAGRPVERAAYYRLYSNWIEESRIPTGGFLLETGQQNDCREALELFLESNLISDLCRVEEKSVVRCFHCKLESATVEPNGKYVSLPILAHKASVGGLLAAYVEKSAVDYRCASHAALDAQAQARAQAGTEAPPRRGVNLKILNRAKGTRAPRVSGRGRDT